MEIIRLQDAKEWPGAFDLSPEELKEAYALARAAFTADDLQKFTEIVHDETPMEVFLETLEKAQEEHDRKQNP